MKDQVEYWTSVSKRGGKLWRGTKNDCYDLVFMTKEDVEDCMDTKYWKAVKIKVILEEEK